MSSDVHLQRRLEKFSTAFSRVDLLTVLAVAGFGAFLLLPVWGSTRQQDRNAVCMNNLRQIGVGMLMFAAENNDTFHNVNGDLPNDGQWFSSPTSTNILAPDNSFAYWGVAYFRNVGSSREVFRCPVARLVDEWRDDGRSYPNEFWLTSTYGVCYYLVHPFNPVQGPLKTHSFASPSTVILSQDSPEARMEGPNDSLGLFPGYSQILTQWLGPSGLANSYYGGYAMQWEWYRHDKKCNTLWLSGNVSKIPFNGLNVGIDYRYYTGDKPLLALPH